MIQVSEVICHHRFTASTRGSSTNLADFTDYGCALLMLFSQIYYWITAANAAMMKPHGICEIPDNRGDSR